MHVLSKSTWVYRRRTCLKKIVNDEQTDGMVSIAHSDHCSEMAKNTKDDKAVRYIK